MKDFLKFPNTIKWDVFISHASEDKDIFVRELANELQKNNLKVWYDEFALKIGDSLRRSIEIGLKESLLGIVVLSKNFFNKEWPQKELDALLSKEIKGRKVILPIWLNLNFNDVYKFSPMLADKFAINFNIGIPAIVEKIINQIDHVKQESNYEQVIAKISRYDMANKSKLKVIYHEIILRLNQIVGCNRDLVSNLNKMYENLEKSGLKLDTFEWNDKIHELITVETKKAYKKYNIPKEIWPIDDYEKINVRWLKNTESLIKKWVFGIISKKGMTHLSINVGEEFDLDVHYIFYGFANDDIGRKSHEELKNHFYKFGIRNLDLKDI